MGKNHWTDKSQARGCYVLKPNSDRAKLIKQEKLSSELAEENTTMKTLLEDMQSRLEALESSGDNAPKSKNSKKGK